MSFMNHFRFHPFIGHEGPQGQQRCSSTLFLTSALEGVRGQRHAPAAPYPLERPGTLCTGPVWTDVENLDPTGIRSSDRPARRQSLYRLIYPASSTILSQTKYILSINNVTATIMVTFLSRWQKVSKFGSLLGLLDHRIFREKTGQGLAVVQFCFTGRG